MQGSTQHLFSQVPRMDVPRSTFDRSHGYKTTFDAGYLVPFFVDEVLPGDTFNCRVNLFARMATPIVPLMDNLYLETFFFYVPNRLVWDHWENMLGAQDNPTDSIDYTVPTITGTNVQNGTLWDYFGLPTNVANPLTVSALPFRAYNLIWNEWMRDTQLQDSVPQTKADSDTFDNYTLLKRGKRHDYITSSLVAAQRGPSVTIGLGTSVPVVAGGTGYINLTDSQNSNNYPNGAVICTTDANTAYFDSLEQFNVKKGTVTNNFSSRALVLDTESLNLSTDLSSASPISINDLRTAFQVQKLYEALNRSGTRYKELLLGVFNVLSPDQRLDRPEYLGGSSSRINIKPVEQNSSTNETTPQGNLAAYGVVGDTFHGFTKSFVEHGWIIGVMNVRADLTYQQGINRMWSRDDRLDFYWPQLAHLGEQAVLSKEIYADGTEDDNLVFGYQERFAEYRYKPAQITGKFRSTDPQSLDIWHLAQEFESRPYLNADFIEENPPLDRVIAVPSEPHFLFDSYVNLKCTRPMPVYSVPGFVDHF